MQWRIVRTDPGAHHTSHQLLPRLRTSVSRRHLRDTGVFSSAATSQTASRTSRNEPVARFEQLSTLAREVLQTAVQTGPKGFTRSLQVANALAGVGMYVSLQD